MGTENSITYLSGAANRWAILGHTKSSEHPLTQYLCQSVLIRSLQRISLIPSARVIFYSTAYFAVYTVHCIGKSKSTNNQQHYWQV
jgi:outer membrane scaffolding protein for murein synthesis (MipA/OmpV family)